MILRASSLLLCTVVFLSACSERGTSLEEEAEWADIQPLTNKTAKIVFDEPSSTHSSVSVLASEGADYAPLARRLKAMLSVERAVGETLLTGEELLFDYEQRFIRMKQDVVLVDDRGQLKADLLEGQFSVSNEVEHIKAKGHVWLEVPHPEGRAEVTGEHLTLDRENRVVRMERNVVVVDARGEFRSDLLIGNFSVSNELETIEAQGHVQMDSEGRTARAENAHYTYRTGFIRLEGQASVAEGKSHLSGERIRLWTLNERKLICEPNVVLRITGAQLEGSPGGEAVDTEIRAGLLVYNESERLAVFQEKVRVRDPLAALNCGRLRLHLKESNEIDWIEALSEVIIHSDGWKALADRASYYADDSKFVLDGEPTIKQGPNIMTGDQIIFWQETQRMVCEPNAHALLYPTEEMKAKFLKDLNE